MPNLSKVEEREKLKPQKEPHWHDLSTGHDLGYRPSLRDKPGSWICRYYCPDTRKRSFKSLGDYGTLLAKERFSAATRDAGDWFRHLSHGGSTEDPTVGEVCEKYAGEDSELKRRFKQYVYGQPISKIKLQRLREHHVREWREHLENLPALVTRSKPKKGKEFAVVTRKRSAATVNRDQTPFRAALNAALSRGEVPTALAWKAALKPMDAKGRRSLYLDRGQRRALLDKLPEDAAAFCRALCLIPLRPGAMAALRVRDFDTRTATLRIDHDKAGAGRVLQLPPGTLALFKTQTKGKLPGAFLFTQANGKPWDKDVWWTPINEAARAAGLPEGTCAYALRHAGISDLVANGLDLMSVARIAGTSVKIIESNYHHLRPEHATAALEGLAL